MIKIKNRFINEDHIIRVKKKDEFLCLYLTSTLKDKTRYEKIEFTDPGQMADLFHEIASLKMMISIHGEIYNKKHIIEVAPIIDHEKMIFQIRITTIENAENKKRKYKVINYSSEMLVRKNIRNLIKICE